MRMTLRCCRKPCRYCTAVSPIALVPVKIGVLLAFAANFWAMGDTLLATHSTLVAIQQRATRGRKRESFIPRRQQKQKLEEPKP
jgi:hypothetical protein